ncbi:hypothetical protein [Streptomyces sp. NPDC005780]|uniref:hypothetical protein n=1 Tax=Streptomyces sp. NPDC005780 TaxID=3364730 RepID=UPI0036CF5C20
MRGEDFSAQATFYAQMAHADGGTGSLSFSAFSEYLPEGAEPISSEDLAGMLRDFYAAKGWVVSPFYGRPNDVALDWPAEIPEVPNADA